jgi:hypothetical protein
MTGAEADDLWALVDELGNASVDDLVDLLPSATLGARATVLAAGLVKELRLLALGVDAPTTVVELPHRHVRRAVRVARESFAQARSVPEELRPWLLARDAWEERVASRSSSDGPDLEVLLPGRLVESVHVDYGYPGNGSIHATLVFDNGACLLIDCRDRVCGYEHEFRMEMARSAQEPNQSGCGPVTLVGRRIDAVVDIGLGFEVDLAIESLPRIYYLTAYDECYLVWRSSPIEEVGL